MLGVMPGMSEPQIPADTADNLRTRSVEVMAVYAVETERLVDSAPRPPPTFAIGDLVLLYSKRKQLRQKLPFGDPKWAGPYKVIGESHPRYQLLSAHGGTTRRRVHARQLTKYYPRT